MLQRGVFIALEGGEGSGKDTQIARLREVLDPRSTVFTVEPGGTEIGLQLRALLLNRATKMEPETELLVFLAARAELMQKIVRPALAEGKTVVSNRFGLSTIAYQIYGRERKNLLPFLSVCSREIVGEDKPYYVLLDIAPEEGLARVEKRGDGKTRFDAESLSFHARVREGYLNHYNEDGRGVLINAAFSIEQVFERVEAQVQKWIGKR